MPRLPPARFGIRLREMLALVAVVALVLAVWAAYFDPVRQWRAAVRDADDGGRRWEAVSFAAQHRVAGLDDAAAVATLVEALGDPSDRVRATAASGLGVFGRPAARGAVPALVRALRDADFDVRAGAARSLALILRPSDPETPAAVAALAAVAKDGNAAVRLDAAYALATLGAGRDAVPVLVDFLRDRDGLRRQYGVEGLRRCGTDAGPAVPALLALVDEPTSEGAGAPGIEIARLSAAEVLFHLGHADRARAVLWAGAASPLLTVRQTAALIAQRLGIPP